MNSVIGAVANSPAAMPRATGDKREERIVLAETFAGSSWGIADQPGLKVVN